MRVATGERRHLLVLAGLVGAAAATIALLMAGPGAERARAAPCLVSPYHSYGGGVLVLGASGCGTDKALSRETFAVSCQGGNAHSFFQFEDETGPYAPVEFTDGPCSATSFVSVSGLGGIDIIDLSAVGPATGFTGTAALDGGDGPDQLFGSGLPDDVDGGNGADLVNVRDGIADGVDCGLGVDAVQADRASLDSVSNCEIADFLPEPVVPAAPPPPATVTPLPTGLRAAAIKKCKKKFPKGPTRKKCIRKAKRLPV